MRRWYDADEEVDKTQPTNVVFEAVCQKLKVASSSSVYSVSGLGFHVFLML